MTGITKDELMAMSRECGLEFCEEESAHSVFVSLAQLHNAILERAAMECEKQIEREKYGHAAHAVLMAKEEILALKINTGD